MTDAHGNTGSASFAIKVVDTTPPIVTVPANKTVDATTPAGRVVTFAASASDIVDGSLTPKCSPSSGSTFPIGMTTVTCSATDAHGNTGSAAFTITVVHTALTLKEAALAGANALLAGAGRTDSDELRDVVRKLRHATDPSNWVDGNHLVVKRGESVFDDEKDAVETLDELIDNKRSKIGDSALQSLIDRLVQADALLASTAIDDAVAAGGNAKKVARARAEFAEGAAALAKGRPGQAIDRYEHAWEQAVDALK